MKVIQKLLKLNKIEYYQTHLFIVNSLLPQKMTPKEIEVLAHFMSFDGNLANDRFGATGRKIVKEALELSDGGLGNHLKNLKDKSLIKESSDVPNKLIILPSISVDPISQDYQFRLVNQTS